MRLGLLPLSITLCLATASLPLLACSFDSQGTPDGSGGNDDVADTGSETTVADESDEIGTDQGTTQTDDPSTTTESTDDPSTESTESTTEATTESTTDETTESTTEETTESTTETTDTGVDPEPYGDCPNGSDDCAPGADCKEDVDFNDNWQVCASPCESTQDCPMANGLPLTCILYLSADKDCYIACNNSDCPVGMQCKTVNFGFDKICAWDS